MTKTKITRQEKNIPSNGSIRTTRKTPQRNKKINDSSEWESLSCKWIQPNKGEDTHKHTHSPIHTRTHLVVSGPWGPEPTEGVMGK